jgi:hypothetical protein
MAHFAQLDENNIVIQVIVIDNTAIGEPNFSYPNTEILGQHFIQKDLNLSGTWKQTSYNRKFRKNYAGTGFTYDPVRDAFIPPKTYPSWVLNEDTCIWESPVPVPDDNKLYCWDEPTLSWIEQ